MDEELVFDEEAQAEAFDMIFAESDHADDQENATAQGGLWRVDDRLADNQKMRFQRAHSVLAEMIYDEGCEPFLSGVKVPRGLYNFLTQKFLPPLNLCPSRHSSIEKIVDSCFHYLDWEEPYFFLVDMPISLNQDSYVHTYKLKERRDGDGRMRQSQVLDPSKIETFSVVRGWNYPHYTQVHQIITHENTSNACAGRPVWSQKLNRNLVREDILSMVCTAVYGHWSNLENMINTWVGNFYEEIAYNIQRSQSAKDIDDLDAAMENDLVVWQAVCLGMFTWLKSPYGLKFLMQYHPFYQELLDWDEENQKIIVAPGTEGWCVVDGWNIHTALDCERLSIEPGTCCVANVPLHCTRRVNAKAVMSPCYCGEYRDFFLDEYGGYRGSDRHHKPTCRAWERSNPPQMVFVSYGALTNILAKEPSNKPGTCPRVSCPKKTCMFHAAPQLTPQQTQYLRVRELTEGRTKMLTAGPNH